MESKIPGGAQLNSKRMEQFSPNYPHYYDEAKGIFIRSGDKTYMDFSTMGIGCAILGYGHEVVDQAVVDAICNCTMTSLNSRLELALADKLIAVHPYYDMVRYHKTGGDALAAAVRVARAKTGKDKVISCGYHGWNDWWLAGNLANTNGAQCHLNITTTAGVPGGLYQSNIFCNVNDPDMLMDELIKSCYNIAAIVFEYARYEMPSREWLNVIATAQKKGIVIIADEVTTGWRYCFGGMHKEYMDIFTPDIVVYGKAISNGYPFSCVIGKSDTMKYYTETFISSTYWTESIGMAAALATITELEKQDYAKRNELQAMLFADFKEMGFDPCGIHGLMHYDIKNMTEWCDTMIAKGFLVTNNLYLSFDHNIHNCNEFLGAI